MTNRGYICRLKDECVYELHYFAKEEDYYGNITPPSVVLDVNYRRLFYTVHQRASFTKDNKYVFMRSLLKNTIFEKYFQKYLDKYNNDFLFGMFVICEILKRKKINDEFIQTELEASMMKDIHKIEYAFSKKNFSELIANDEFLVDSHIYYWLGE